MASETSFSFADVPSECTEKRIEDLGGGVSCLTLPYSAGELALYAISDGDDTLFVDAGEAFAGGPEPLMEHCGVAAEDTRLFITHRHMDHVGALDRLARAGVQVYLGHSSEVDCPYEQGALLRNFGVPEYMRAELEPVVEVFVSNTADPSYDYEVEFLDDGSLLKVGSREFQVREMKGHCRGHVGLYEAATKSFWPGDQVIDGIVSAIGSACFDHHDLANYFDSLNEVASWDIETLYPGHKTPVYGRENIQALIAHNIRSYEKLIRGTERVLKKADEPLSVYEVSKRFYALLAETFDELVPSNRVFRMAKMFAYLEYAYDKGSALRHMSDSGEALYEFKR